MIGGTIGHFRIDARIGAGGMGEVYRAHDTKLDRDVALKVLPSAVAHDPDRLARFHREAVVLGSLSHPAIAHLYGLEDADGVHALVMELVEGPTLADRIGEGAVPIDEALAIGRQIVEALDAAHEKGIVHRDLKPANIKVRDDGAVKVLDFGLAKALAPDGTDASAEAANSPTLTARATQLGVILGTAAYMAPEQAKGRPVDRRADIWAFGVVLFEMLSGQRAFKGEDISDVLAAVLRQEIDWAVLPADTPPSVRRLLRRCLERDPRRRLRDIGDALPDLDASQLDAVHDAHSPSEGPPSRAQLGTWLPWVAAAVVAGSTVGWAHFRTATAAPAPVVRAEFATKDFAGLVDVSHDGTKVVYVTFGGGVGRLMLRRLNEFDGKLIPGGENAAFPIFSPDGQWIAFQTLTSPFQIKKIASSGGSPVTLCTGSFFNGAAWGPDGTIVFVGTDGLIRVSSDGGEPESLTRVTKGEIAHVRPQFLPDGRRILFTVKRPNRADFAVLDLKTRAYQLVANAGGNGRYVSSGHLVYERGGTVFARPFDLASLTPPGPEVPVIEGVSVDTPDGGGDYSVSDSGLLVYSAVPTSEKGTTLAWVDRKGSPTALPGPSRQLWGSGHLSPDGREVVNSIENGQGTDIWILDVARGALTRLTTDGASDRPIWTPDGREIAFASSAGGHFGIDLVPADGSGKPRRLLETRTHPDPDSFTPDGKTLLFDEQVNLSPVQIYQTTVTGKGATDPIPIHQTTAIEKDGQVSPDGRWLAYQSNESGELAVYVQPFPGPGPKIRVSEDGGILPRWSPDGRELYYWVDLSQLMAVEMRNGVPGPPALLFHTLIGSTFDVAPGGDRFLQEMVLTPGGSTIATVTNWFEELRERAPVKR
ncbi:MAG TPA: protein kinase [Vicinamibacterales bacterium]|jgi:Tol biopolymer transport system component|nr:protein kinase [Vicinamibacterales bacterium]